MADTDVKGTLRGSIEEANAHPGIDLIPIDVTGTIELGSALPAISDDVAISGPGAAALTVARNAASEFRILDFTDGVEASVTGLTIAGGADPQGAGIRNGSGRLTLVRVVIEDNEARAEDAPTVEVEGGGVLSEGWLTLRESVVQGNTAAAISGGTLTSARGGGVVASGPVLITRSTINGNASEAHGNGGKQSKALGGGLWLTGGPAFVDLSTISGNSGVADTSLTNEARGGGLQGEELTLSSSTVTGNSVTSIGAMSGANLELAGSTQISNTLVANALGGESCGAPANSSGFNLDEDGSCGFGKSSDIVGVVAGLDPVLRDNGGPTPTHALFENSTAIDRGNSFGSSVDQRGLPRPSDFPEVSNKEGGDGSDIGAFELQVPSAPGGGTPILISETPGDTTPLNTRIVSGPPRNTFKRQAKFRFASTEAQSHFQCKLDKKKWNACGNPLKRSVKPGKHVFKVRAIDRFGNVDPTPARFGWRVKPIGG